MVAFRSAKARHLRTNATPFALIVKRAEPLDYGFVSSGRSRLTTALLQAGGAA